MSKKISVLLSLVMVSFGLQAAINPPPNASELLKEYGLDESFLAPQNLFGNFEATLTQEQVQAYNGFKTQLCSVFKQSEMTFHLALTKEGKLQFALQPLAQGIEVKIKC